MTSPHNYVSFLDPLGISSSHEVHADGSTAELLEAALRSGEGHFAENGAFVVKTGKFTGRSPKDKFIVEEPSTQDKLWWGVVNHKMTEAAFDRLYEQIKAFVASRPLYVEHLYGGADARYRLPVRVITQYAWHALFARTLLVRPDLYPDPPDFNEEAAFTLIDCPGVRAMPEKGGAQSETFIAIHLAKRLVLIGGTEYAGEIKKSVFTLLNYLLPQQNLFPMHCSANIGRDKRDTALFFGLSGTGKTTLSADPTRDLIGDDEHGWSEEGVFNFEGGCYAKCIRLSRENEPQIWNAVKFGSVLENVVLDEQTRELDYSSAALTENTRAAYPVDFIPGARIPGVGGHPKNLFFLTADAFGVLPPIAKLTPAQARFQFISGYTAKVAGTERGMGSEPEATFSACFGQPFLPLHPTTYAALLGERLTEHEATCWLINTGWSGGAYGEGQRISIKHTRALLDAALNGDLAEDKVAYRTDPVFGLYTPTEVPGVPQTILNPRDTWKDPNEYDRAAQRLAKLFVENFKKYASEASDEVIAALPKTNF